MPLNNYNTLLLGSWGQVVLVVYTFGPESRVDCGDASFPGLAVGNDSGHSNPRGPARSYCVASGSTFFRRSIIAYSWWAGVFQAPLIAWVLCWLLFTPSPGFAVAVLAFTAGVMAVRTEHFTRTEQVVWILIAGALCFVELRAISKDHEEHDALEASIRWQDDSNRRQERRQFEALLRQGSELFKQQKRLSKQTSDEITGGDSYPMITPITTAIDGRNTLALGMSVYGENTLFEVWYRLEEGRPPFIRTAKELEDFLYGRVPQFKSVGTLVPRAGALLAEQIKPSVTGTTPYYISMSARNGMTVEELEVRLKEDKSKWELRRKFYNYKIIMDRYKRPKEQLKLLREEDWPR